MPVMNESAMEENVLPQILSKKLNATIDIND
jgi:hypothetical protein